MTDQPRALDTGRYVTNGSSEAHNALVSRLVSAKRQPSSPAPVTTPTTYRASIPPDGGYRVTVPTTAADPSGDHSRLIADLAERKHRL